MAIIRGIVAGERHPQVLAAHKDRRIQATVDDIAAALTGDYRIEQVFIRRQELQLYEVYQSQLATSDVEIEHCLAQFATQVDPATPPLPKPKRRGKKQPGNAPNFDLRTQRMHERMAAPTLCRSYSALGAFYRRMPARLGAPKAITAAAHKLARIFYHLWTKGGTFVDFGIESDDQQYRERTLKHLKKKAQALGFNLVEQPPISECVS